MSEKHLFPGKTVNMVIACKVISDHFETNIAELSKVRTNWTPEYAGSLRTSVDSLGAAYLGVNTRDDLFNATKILTGLVGPAKEKLSAIKTQIGVDFKKDAVKRNTLLTKLGYSVANGVHPTQSELVAHLSAFKRNLTPELTAELTAGGMPAAILNEVAQMADEIDKANTAQESLKGSAKEATGKIIGDLNNLYEELIGICKIASNFYRKNPVKREMFTFSRILRNLGETAATIKEIPVAENK